MNCYMCDKESTSTEHVPPDCFFPPGHRMNLITVPSCPEHNFKKSMDDEYVYSIIAPTMATNSLAQNTVVPRINRSFQHSGGLVAAVFNNAKVVKMADGRETVGVKVVLERWDRFFEHLANAVYFHDFKATNNISWSVWTPYFVLEGSTPGQPDDSHKEFNQRLSMWKFVEHSSSNPEIFRYFFFQHSPERYAFKFVFYEGFVVYTFASRAGRAFA